MVERGASDLFFSTGTSVQAKVEGVVRSLDTHPMDATRLANLAYSLMTYEQIKEFEATLELNMAVSFRSLGRFRVNAYRQRGDVAMVIRHIKSEIPSLEALGLPASLGQISCEKQGQVLVCGATGAGKSTTLAAMINHRNVRMTGHILTVEDPIEFLHEHKKSVVDQREVGLDTLSYGDALQNALRQAPDVIAIGEIRDRMTMEHAHHFAETGHLCLSTLHANNASQALDRMMHFFPSDARDQVLHDIALHLRAIICQRLIQNHSGKVVPAVEILVNTPRIAELIMEGRISDVREAMKGGEGRGMFTFDQSLYDLYRNGTISEEDALRNADSQNDLRLRIHMGRATMDDRVISIDDLAPGR
ncbi:MAG: PilT/PilU family type 4a pilus ATPase [Gammaproteobacteria bacterium]|nr:PilT/PilU family type 4a pilus ATPase [Gammaproteobacteria bacterium]